MKKHWKRQYAVEKTNDSSIVSKASMVEKGYFDDPFLKHFVKKISLRSSLINRGYYIRAKALEYVLKNYFELVKNEVNFQVVSFGAGFDSAYFRIKSIDSFPSHARYFEIDFPSVIERKIGIITSDNELLNLIGDYTTDSTGLHAASYRLISCDLSQLDLLKSKLIENGINFNAPTLFISECAITYMKEEESSKLIQFSALNFTSACFATYEQVCPNDGFGIVMKQHFEKLGSPLKSIDKYDTPDSQKERYISFGWPKTTVMDMNTFFLNVLKSEERLRIYKIEMFDEYEEIHLKYSHYVLILATKGSLLEPMTFTSEIENSTGNFEYSKMKIEWDAINTDTINRFGHSSNLIKKKIVSIGGFGDCNGLHKRMSNVCASDVEAGENNNLKDNCNNFKLDRLFHQTVKASDGSLIILGGRFSPKQACNEILKLDLIYSEDGSLASFNSNCIGMWNEEIPPRWRHSSTLITSEDGTDQIFCFGGISSNGTVLCDFAMFNLHTCSWTKIESRLFPRHSHSSCIWQRNKLVITGGLSKEEVCMSTVDLYDTDQKVWETIHLKGILPRCSHTSNVYKDKLLLLGGVNNCCGNLPGLAVIDLVENICVEYKLPGQNIERPIILHKHSTVLIGNLLFVFGGGGNCFSFGTHFNSNAMKINCDKVI